MRDAIYAAIEAERGKQDAKWGGAAHDDMHLPDDWEAFMNEHAFKAVTALPANPAEYRRRMVEVAALAVAAIEAWDRVAIAERL